MDNSLDLAMQLDIDDMILIEEVGIFLQTFNRKPHTNLYYSEKLLTLKQKQNYEKAIEKISKILNERRNFKFETSIENEIKCG